MGGLLGMKGWQLLLLGLLLGLLASGTVILISKPNYGQPIELLPPPTATATSFPKPTATQEPIIVQIGGEIQSPGLYRLSKNARVNDLIELANGLTKFADIDRINLSTPLRDGDYIYIPAIDEVIPDTARNAPILPDNSSELIEFPLNLNEASQDELEALPGIGPIKAADIIAYRENTGPFTSVDDLLKVEGIGTITLETLREYLFVEP
jgi:competence protein ComEA